MRQRKKDGSRHILSEVSSRSPEWWCSPLPHLALDEVYIYNVSFVYNALNQSLREVQQLFVVAAMTKHCLAKFHIHSIYHITSLRDASYQCCVVTANLNWGVRSDDVGTTPPAHSSRAKAKFQSAKAKESRYSSVRLPERVQPCGKRNKNTFMQWRSHI